MLTTATAVLPLAAMATDELPRSLKPDGSLPDERFRDAGELRDFADRLITADRPRASNRGKVQGLIDGNRPTPQGVLTGQQQGWRANVNYREGEGQVQAQRTPYYDLATENDPCVSIELDYGRGQQRTDWEEKIATHLHWLFHGSTKGFDFNWHLQLQQSEMCVHGWGSHVFLSRVDWRPTTRQMRHVLFPDRTNSCLDDSMEAFLVREPMKAHQLYRNIRKEPAAKSLGWQPSNVKNAIITASRSDGGGARRRTVEDFQAMMKNNDLGYSFNRSRDIWLNHVFVREFEGGKNGTGGVSHYIIQEGQTDYLFRKRNRFDEWDQIVKLFPYDIGSDGTLHSIRGLGVRIYPFCELSNRLKNHMVDSVLVGSGVLLTQRGSVDLTKLALTSVGPMKLLPANVEPSQYKMMDLSQGPLALSRELQQTSMENNKTYRQGVSDTSGSVERTATEAQLNAQDSASLTKSSHNMYYNNLDGLYAEMTRRACNSNYSTLMPGGERAVEFQRRCIRDGVPKEALAKIVRVTAVRSIGAGSASNRIMIARELMQTIYPGADEVARGNIKRDYIASIAGSRNVDRYAPPIDVASAADNDDSIAVLENDALLAGGEALVSSSQNHMKHAMRHMVKADQLYKAFQAGQMQPEQLLGAWDAIGPHVAAHMGYLEQDPTRKAVFFGLHQQFVTLTKLADKLRQHIQAQQAQAKEQAAAAQAQQQQQQQQPTGPFQDEGLNLEWQKMQGELQIKMQKVLGDLNLKQQKLHADNSLKDASTAADIRRQNVSTAAAVTPQ